MQAMLKNPKFYIWTVLVLLPLQALTFMYSVTTNASAWMSLIAKDTGNFERLTGTSNTLIWISLALIVFDIACLHIALSQLKNNGGQKSPSIQSAMGPQPAGN